MSGSPHLQDLGFSVSKLSANPPVTTARQSVKDLDMKLNPIAQSLNEKLEEAAPEVLAMLSEYGRRLYFPKGITHSLRDGMLRHVAVPASAVEVLNSDIHEPSITLYALRQWGLTGNSASNSLIDVISIQDSLILFHLPW